MSYIKDSNKNGCIFCELPAQAQDEENLILYRGQKAFVILNRYPYVSGHLMVVPYRHTDDLASLEEAEWAEIFGLIRPAVKILEEEYRPQGFNIGINLGRVAGAGVEGHVHVHIVPRWGGDSNFVSVVGETRVIPEALEETYKRLHPRFMSIGKEGER